VLKFLIQRGFVRLSVGSSGLSLYPGLDPAHGLYQSADFPCRDLDTFELLPLSRPSSGDALWRDLGERVRVIRAAKRRALTSTE
jgi:hypothetical protein